MRRNRCSRGQALVEAVWALPILSCAFCGFLALIYVGFVRSFIGYQSDQALFCVAQGESEYHCQNTAKQRLQSFLPLGELRSFHLTSQDGTWRANVDWQWIKIHIKKQRTLKWDSSIWR